MQNLSRSRGSAKWSEVGEAYRKYVYISGGAKGLNEDGRPTRAGFTASRWRGLCTARDLRSRVVEMAKPAVS